MLVSENIHYISEVLYRDVISDYSLGDISDIIEDYIGYPELKSGAVVDTSKVKVILKNGYQYLTGFCSVSGAYFTGNVGEDFITANSVIMEGPGLNTIKVGDFYYLNSCPMYKYEIKSIDGDKVYLTSTLKFTITSSIGHPFSTIRHFDTWDITSLCARVS